MSLPAWLLAALFTAASPAAQARDPAHPTERDMAAWKHGVIDRFDRAAYLDEEGRAISERTFFRLVRTELRNHVIETAPGSKALITLRLLPRVDPVLTPANDDTVSTLAATMHGLTKPYHKTVYRDERGEAMSEDGFLHAVVRERRRVVMQSVPGDMKLMTLRLLPRA